MIFTIFSSLINLIWRKNNSESLSYLGNFDLSYTDLFFIKWGTWIMIFTNFVPISLIVVMEFVKLM